MASNLRFDARRDSNEREIVDALRKIGGVWYQHMPVDGLVGIPSAGVWFPAEIKRPEMKSRKREFTDAQIEFFADRATDRLPFAVWRDIGDMLETLNRIRVGER